jgi:hypothetical protein
MKRIEDGMDDERMSGLHHEGQDVFIVVDGVKIAKRKTRASSSATNWIMLEPGWVIRDVERGGAIEITFEGATIH